MGGIEPPTSSLPRKCSTTELQRRLSGDEEASQYFIYPAGYFCFFMSGRPGSNRPPIAWKAIALPNELLPLKYLLSVQSGENRIRTYED